MNDTSKNEVNQKLVMAYNIYIFKNNLRMGILGYSHKNNWCVV